MTDDADLEPIEPTIDVRSPGERWAESGRASAGRLRRRVDEEPFDTIALAWMVLLLVITGVQIYSALRFDAGDFPGGDDWWFKLGLLAQTSGAVLIWGSVIGIALAVLFEGTRSRLALRLAVIGGAWVLLSSLIGVAVSFHEARFSSFTGGNGLDNKILSAVAYLAFAGLGLLIVLVGSWFAKSDAGSAEVS